MKKGIYFSIIVFIFASCTKNYDPVNCIDDICIDGEWIWVKSQGTFAWITTTPESKMTTKKLIIDEKNYQEFEDDELILDTTYEYVKSDELSVFSIDSLVLKLADGTKYSVKEENGNLILVEPCLECWEHTYTRK